MNDGCPMIRNLLKTLIFLVWMIPENLSADVRLPRIFGSHMVLQQEKPIEVWGWADSGEEIAVQLGREEQKTTCNEKGEWRVTFPPEKASFNAFTLTIKGSKNTVTLEDVLVGEVWLASGQSNMAMGITLCQNHDQEISAANHPEIRLFLIPRTISLLPNKDLSSPLFPEKELEATWKVCSAKTIVESGWGGFSGVAYFFGRELSKSLKVPMGLIQAAWGGTPIEAWTPAEGFAKKPSLKSVYQNVQEIRDYYRDRSISEEIKAMKEEVIQGKTSIPTVLYNAMIHPLVPLSLRGIIWYQGEANCYDGKIYTDKTEAQVESWRKAFAQSDLPYYYCQIAPWKYPLTGGDPLPVFWEAQTAALKIPNTGMVVTTDLVDDINNQHPTNKKEVGVRLARWALAKTYGREEIVYSGPVYKSVTAEGNQMRVTFDSIGGGLKSRDGKPLTDFEISSGEGDFVPAKATMEGDAVVLSAEGVDRPQQIRFAWRMTAQPNFENQAGLPAIPFRAEVLK